MFDFTTLLHLKPIPADHWTVSNDNKRLKEVTSFSVGIDPLSTRGWVEFAFVDNDNNTHTLKGDIDVKTGDENVHLDGNPKAHPRIVLSHRVVMFSFRVVVEFHFDYNDGVSHVYRFDGRLN